MCSIEPGSLHLQLFTVTLDYNFCDSNTVAVAVLMHNQFYKSK